MSGSRALEVLEMVSVLLYWPDDVTEEEKQALMRAGFVEKENGAPLPLLTNNGDSLLRALPQPCDDGSIAKQ